MPCASIIWLARAVKVERPFAPRLHLDCARFAKKGVRLGNTLGVCKSGLETFGRAEFVYRKRLIAPVSNERDKTHCIL